jgi:hypothetical protein
MRAMALDPSKPPDADETTSDANAITAPPTVLLGAAR